MSPMSAESTVVRNYLEWRLAIPWPGPPRSRRTSSLPRRFSTMIISVVDKVKERIVDTSPSRLANKLTGPILPGRAGRRRQDLPWQVDREGDRPPVRAFSLGVVPMRRKIRGHRRTYIGSMPGKVVQSMRKASHRTPVLARRGRQDGADFPGHPRRRCWRCSTPSRTTLTTTTSWSTTISAVMFLTTANTLNIPPPLIDRMRSSASPATRGREGRDPRKHLIPRDRKTGLLPTSCRSTTSRC